MKDHQISEKTIVQLRKIAEPFISAGIICKEELDILLKSAKTNQEPTPKPPALISRAKGALILGISTRSLDRILKDGFLSRVQVGKRSIRLDQREIEKYVAENTGCNLIPAGEKVK